MPDPDAISDSLALLRATYGQLDAAYQACALAEVSYHAALLADLEALTRGEAHECGPQLAASLRARDAWEHVRSLASQAEYQLRTLQRRILESRGLLGGVVLE